MKRLALNFGVMKKARLFGLAVLAIMLGSSEVAKAATYTVAQTGKWSESTTWSGTVPSSTITLNEDITINIPDDVTLTIDENVSITQNGSYVLTLSGGSTGQIVISEGVKFTLKNNAATGQDTKDKNRVNLQCDIDIAENATLELDVLNVAFDFDGGHDITGSGTVHFSRTASSGDRMRIQVSNLTKPITGCNIIFATNQKFTYENTCTYVLPGTYWNMSTRATSMYVYDKVIVTNESWLEAGGITYISKSNKAEMSFNKFTGGSGQPLTFNVDVTLTGSDFSKVSSLAVADTNTLTIAADITWKEAFAVPKNLIVANSATLTFNKNAYFSKNTTISGEGDVAFKSYVKAVGKKLTTYLHVVLESANNDMDIDTIEVKGGKFEYLRNKPIRSFIVDGGEFEINPTGGTSINVNGIAELKSGTLKIDDGKTMKINKVGSDTLKVTGNSAISGTGYLDGVVAVYETGNLTIADDITIRNLVTAGNGATIVIASDKTLTLKNPLQVNSDVTISGNTVGSILKWDDGVTPKINVTAGTLTISNTLTVAGDVTLEGAMKVAEGGNLNLAGSTITFGPTAKFTGTQGNISFVEGVVISGLKNDPDVKAKYLKFPGAVTYDATCAAMFPGVYGNGLTLSTEAGKNIAIYDSVTITGALNWAAGRIVLNGNPLFINKIFTAGDFGKSHMVVAGKRKVGDETKTGKFIYIANEAVTSGTLDLYIPIGTSSLSSSGALQYSFSPATINVDVSGEYKVAVGDTIVVQVEGETLLSKATDLRRYWTIYSKKEFTGTVEFTYEPKTDDVLGYGKGTYWRVYHNDVAYDADSDPQSPFDSYTFGNASITAASSKKIRGTWTACEWPTVTTLYSFGNGDWDSPSTWTNNSAGSTQPEGWNTSPKDGDFDIVILQNNIITGTSEGIRARSVTLKAESSVLVIPTICSEVSINDLSGEGKLTIQNSGEFPEGISRTELFMAPGGGTTEFCGTADGDFVLRKNTFNNLIVNLNGNAKISLPDTMKMLQINGDFDLEKGKIIYTAGNQAIHVDGKLKIESGGYIINESGAGNQTIADTLQIGGDFINRGIVKLTKRVWKNDNAAHYAMATADEDSNGRGILRFVGEKDAAFDCYDTINISQLIVDKGSDITHKVTLNARKKKVFGLLGKAAFPGAPGFASGADYPANPDVLYKPLWLRNGTLELTGEVEIKSLSEGPNNSYDCAYIPVSGCLHLNGPHVKVQISSSPTKISWTDLIPAGKLIVEQGELNGNVSSGITFSGTSIVEIRGGEVHVSQFRPSDNAARGITTYIQTGGIVEFHGGGDINENYPIFFMPEPSYTFKMTDGTLEVGSAMANGAFVVKSNPENGRISGGEIIINTGKAIKGGSDKSSGEYLIATELPLFNLTLKNEGKRDLAAGKYKRHYIGDCKKTIRKYTCNITATTIIQNNLTIEGDGVGGTHNVVFDTQGKPITIGGSLLVKDGAKVYTMNDGGVENEFIFNGNGEITVAGLIAQNKDNEDKVGFANLTIAEGAETAINGNVTVRERFTLADHAKLVDGTTNNVYTMEKDVEIDGTHEQRGSGAGKMVLKGDYIYTTGSGVLNNVEIARTGELKLEDPNNSGRQTKLTITGNLNFVDNAQFVIGSSNLELGADATVSGAFGPNCMIRTVGASSRGVTKVYGGASVFRFPFGFKDESTGKSYYTPAEIKYNSAGTYGSVTSRPVHGYAFRDAETDGGALACYWITEERGFSNANLTQHYYWYDDELSVGAKSAVPAWQARRRVGSEWLTGSSNVVLTGTIDDPDEKFIYYDPSVTNATGYYTCGSFDSFSGGKPLYTSNYVKDGGDGTLSWFDWHSWSDVGVGEDPCENCVPTATTPVYIGNDSDDGHHTVKINLEDRTDPEAKAVCASLNIAPGSVLDLNGYAEFATSIVEVDEAVGAGTLRVKGDAGSCVFPAGDFGVFNGEHGGTVEYYGNGYAIPKTSADGSSLTNYCNLRISGGGSAADSISMPDCNITVFDSLAVGGRLCTNPGGYTIDIHKNLNVLDGATFEVFENGSDAKQIIKVGGSLIVGDGATLIANATAAENATVTNLMQIGGDLNVGNVSKFEAKHKVRIGGADKYPKFDIEFVGTTESHIWSDKNMILNMLTCNKASLNNKLILNTNKSISTANPNALLKLEKGTFVVQIGEDEYVELTSKADLDIPGEACLSIVSGTALVATVNDAPSIKLKGKIQITGGKLNVGSSDSRYNSIQYAADGRPTIEISGGQLNVVGQISRTKDQTTGNLVWKQTGGDVVIKGGNRGAGTWLDNFAAFEILGTGEFEMSGGTITVMKGSGGDNSCDILIDAATASCTGGRIIVGGGSQKIKTLTKLNELEVSNGATLSAYTDINVGELIINSTGVFNALNHNLTISKAFRNFNNNGGSEISEGFNYGDGNQLTLFAGDDVTYEGAAGFASQFKEVEINGNLTMVANHSAMRVGGNLTQTAGTVTDNGNVISLYGNLTYYGIFKGTGGIDFIRNDGAEQYIEGNSAGKIGKIIVSNSNEVYLNSDLHITNKIVLGASLYVGRMRVILDKDATIEAKEDNTLDATHMLRLNGMHEDNGVIKYVKTGKSKFIIPIGIMTDGNRYYTPAIYDFASNNCTNGSISVKAINSLHTNLTYLPTKSVDYYWLVTTQGFGEDGIDNFSYDKTSNFSVKQTYVFPNGKVNGSYEKMFPEYMYYGGSDEYRWIDLRENEDAGRPEKASISADSIKYEPFGYIAGDYTAGIIVETVEEETHEGIYVGRPVLYTGRYAKGKGSKGGWDTPSTWYIKDEFGAYFPYSTSAAKIDGNPVHILPGDTVVVTRSGTKAYSLTFDEGEELGVLNITYTVGSDFGPVKGVGHLMMEPVPVADPYYKMPAGNFNTFLKDERSVVEFTGGSGKLPNSIIGHSSMPLQNVILSGGGTKTLTKELGEYINKSMIIRKGTKLNFGNTPIYIMGDWIDENTEESGFVPGTSSDRSIVNFNGTTRQHIKLSGANEPFWKLNINNPEGVEVVKHEKAAEDATAKITISKLLTFTNGCLIDTAANTNVMLSSNATVSGAGTTGFVAGPLSKDMAINSTFEFPIGDIDKTDGKVYGRAKLNSVTAAGIYTMRFHSGKFAFKPVWPFTAISNTEYWEFIDLPDGAKAKLTLRAAERSFDALTNDLLSGVMVAGDTEEEVVEDIVYTLCEQIKSTKSGSLPSSALITTKEAIALDSYPRYTLGISSPVAKLISGTLFGQTETYTMCDGDAETVSIPVYFTGSGGPYVAKYTVTNADRSKSVVKSVIASAGSDMCNIILTGNDLASFFGTTEGNAGSPYTIVLSGMTDNGKAGVVDGDNTAIVKVLYNAKPVITGADIVGKGDKRLYSIATGENDQTYLWSAIPTVSVEITIEDNDNYESNIIFGNDNNLGVPYNVTLTATKEYKVVDGKACERSDSKKIEVRDNPQPKIMTDGSLGVCRTSTRKYWTDYVDGHTYIWTITEGAGNITSSSNECNVEWSDTYGSSTATLTVVETNGGLSGTASIVIPIYDAIADDVISDISSPDICDDNLGVVNLTTRTGLTYSIYHNDSQIGEDYIGDGGEKAIMTGTPLRYESGSSIYNYSVRVKNAGCSKDFDGEGITIHENPSIDEFTIADDELYKGNLVQIDYEKTSTVGIKDYQFDYSGVGVSYVGGIPSRIDRTIDKPMVITIPNADRMKGVLTINSVGSMTCSNTYEVDKPISEAYLWKGADDENTSWNSDANWWIGSVPNDGVDVVIRKNKKITTAGGKTSEDINMPTVFANAEVRDINVDANANVTVDNGKSLTVKGNVINNGSFISNNSGKVEFSSGSHTVSGAGSFANLSNEGTVTAANDIKVKGNITNNGSFTGTVKLEGESTQIIGGGSFENVTVNSTGVTINSNINIDGKLTLTKGVVSVNGGQALVFTKNAKPVAGASANSYVDGTIWKYGKTPFVFPTGSNGRLAQIGIAPGSDATDATYYSASYTLVADKEPLTTGLPTGMSRVSQAETWLVDCPGGKSSKLTLYWSDAEASGITPGKESDLVVAHFTEGKWKAEPAKFDGVNSITTTAYITSYSPFTFGAKNPEPDINPLPVTFAAFTGRQAGNSIVLEWTTLSEKDNDYFEIERSTDGVNFVTIGFVDGAGNSNSLISYQFIDNAPEQGQLYYRLSQVDFDGTREYADKIVTVFYSGDETGNLRVVPNPTSGLFRVVGSKAGGRIELLSQSGMVIRIIDINSFDATIDISDLPSGIYVLRFVTDTKVLQQKVVKY